MAASKHCFYPNGDLITGDTPCFPDLDVSPCCGRIGDCQTANGLCTNNETLAEYRATCTDLSWKSPNCPQYCLKNEFQGQNGKNFSNRHPRIWPCSDKPFAEGGLMCCDIAEVDVDQRERSCCPEVDGGINLFVMGSKLDSPVTIVTPSPSALSTSSTSSSTSSPNSRIATVTASPQSSPEPKGSGSTVGIAVGASVGGISFLILIAILYFWLRRRRSKLEPLEPQKPKEQEKDGYEIQKVTENVTVPFQGFQEIAPPGIPAVEVPGPIAFELPSKRDSRRMRSELPD